MIRAVFLPPPPPLSGSLREFFAERFRPIRLLGVRPLTIEAYTTALNHWDRWEAATPVELISTEMVARLAARLLEWQAPPTVNKSVRHWMAIFRFAVKEGRLPRLPDWKKLREPLRAPLAFTEEEFSRILKAASELPGEWIGVPAAAWWRAVLLTIWYTGSRISALLAVETIDFDRTAGGIYLRSDEQKDHADQFLDLGDDAIAALEAVYRPGLPLLFGWPYASDHPAVKRFKRIAAAAGVPLREETGSKFHRIRKSTASYLKINGGDPTSRLGHSTPKVTDRYFDPRIVTEARQARFMPRPR